MKIYSINGISKNNINFCAKPEQLKSNDIDEYLRQNRVSLYQTSNDLLVISDRANKEKSSLIHLKRTINEQKELEKLGNIENPFDLITQFESTDSLIQRIFSSQKMESPGIIGNIMDEDITLKGIYRKGSAIYSDGVKNSNFINTVRIPELNIQAIGGFGGNESTKLFEEIFTTFKLNDTQLLSQSLDAFHKISKKYIDYTSKRLKDIKEMYSVSHKIGERIPVLGVVPKIERVSKQQQAIKYVYMDYNDYCNTFIHKHSSQSNIIHQSSVILILQSYHTSHRADHQGLISACCNAGHLGQESRFLQLAWIWWNKPDEAVFHSY